MLLSTGDIQNFKITNYIGIVTGTEIYGSSIVKDFGARIKDFIGGRAKGYTDNFDEYKAKALSHMIDSAKRHDADAVIGIQHAVAVVPSEQGGLFVISVLGTAVKGEQID